MTSLIEECMKSLRQEVRFSLVDGGTHLLEPQLYPFEGDKLPIMCEFIDEQVQSYFGYKSGNRSVVFPYNGGWFKAKAIGIPVSGPWPLTQPLYHEGKILGYYLYDEPYMGAGSVIWGYLKYDEAKSEMKCWRTRGH